MEICKRCGNCCKNAYLSMDNFIYESKEGRAMSTWLNNYGCETSPMKKGDRNVLLVKLPNKCQHLNENNGCFSCNIYEQRPLMCKNYKCQDYIAKEEIEKMLKENPNFVGVKC